MFVEDFYGNLMIMQTCIPFSTEFFAMVIFILVYEVYRDTYMRYHSTLIFNSIVDGDVNTQVARDF